MIIHSRFNLFAKIHKNEPKNRKFASDMKKSEAMRISTAIWTTLFALAICNYVIPSDHYTVWCTARKDDGPEGFIIVFNYVDPQHYCQLNFGCGGNTQHAIELISVDRKKQLATRPGSVETGKWYDVKLTVAGDTVKAWLDNELMFEEVLK